MPKFLIKASYTSEGTRGLLKEGGTRRRDAVRTLVEGLGGKVEAFYFAFGEDDLYVITELPNTAARSGPHARRQRLGRGPADDHTADLA